MADPAEQLAALLGAHPDAWVSGVSPDGLYVELPPSFPVGEHRLLQGRWVMDHIAVGHRAPLSEAWRRRGEDGHVDVRVQLVDGSAATFHIFDVSAVYGVDVTVVLADGDLALDVPPAAPEIQTSSRFSRTLRDGTGRTVEIDAAAPELLGWSADVLLSRRPPLDRVHPEDQHQIIESWMSTLAEPDTGHRARVRLLRSDGTYRWFEVTNFNRLDDAGQPHVVTEFLDISDEMAAHEAVRAREQMLHRLAETLPLGVLQLDPDRRVVYKNDYLSGIVGEEDASTADEQFASIVDEDRPRLEKAFAVALDAGS